MSKEMYGYIDDSDGEYDEPDLSWCRLCYECKNLIDIDECEKYPRMKIIMFGRKAKCKHFKRIDQPSYAPSLEDYLDDNGNYI